MSKKPKLKKLDKELLRLINEQENKIEDSVQSKENKEGLEQDIQEAVILNEVNENLLEGKNLLEGIIEQESKLLNIIKQENSKIVEEIDEKIEGYSPEKKVKEKYLSKDSNDEKKYDEKKYDFSNSNLIEIESEKFVRFREKEKKKDERKYIPFKQSY